MPIIKCKEKTKKAFSLMELLIITAVISIMTVASLVYLGGQKEDKELEVEANKMASAIREAQNNALTGKQPDNASVACGHGFYFDNDGTLPSSNIEYKIFFNSDSSGCGAAGRNYDEASSNTYIKYELGNNVEFNSSLAMSIYFTVPHGKIFDNAENAILTAQTITLKGRSGDTYNVCIYPGGKIEAKESGC